MKISNFKSKNVPELLLLNDFFNEWDLHETKSTLIQDYLDSLKEYLNIHGREISLEDLLKVEFDGLNSWKLEALIYLVDALKITNKTVEDLFRTAEENNL